MSNSRGERQGEKKSNRIEEKKLNKLKAPFKRESWIITKPINWPLCSALDPFIYSPPEPLILLQVRYQYPGSETP